MSVPGIVGTLRLAGVVVLAVPPTLFGIERLLRGDPLGLAFVALGGLMIGFERLLTDPFDPVDLGESAIERVAERALEDD